MIKIINKRAYAKLNDVEKGEIVLRNGKVFEKVVIENNNYILDFKKYMLFPEDDKIYELCDAEWTVIEESIEDMESGKVIIDEDKTYVFCKMNESDVLVCLEDGTGKFIDSIDNKPSNLTVEITIY